jgi:asparagine synthase (glutamine-hydrolysing)
MIERIAPFYRSALPSSLRRAAAAVFGESPGQRTSSFLGRRLALLATAGAQSARDAFVYDRGFRAFRAEGFAGSLRDTVASWHPDELYAAAWDRAVGTDDVDRALYGDLTTYLPDQLLAKADVSAMAHGLEARSPFLAREIIEYAATLPTALRLRNYETKHLLKKVAERYVPAEAINRPKRGFVIPASQWLRTDLAPFVSGILDAPRFLDRSWIRPDLVRRLIREHASGSHDWGNQLWTLLVLEIWAQLTIDRTLSPTDSLDVLLEHAGTR